MPVGYVLPYTKNVHVKALISMKKNNHVKKYLIAKFLSITCKNIYPTFTTILIKWIVADL